MEPELSKIIKLILKFQMNNLNNISDVPKIYIIIKRRTKLNL